MLHVRDEAEPVKAPVPKLPFSVVVETPLVRVAFVPRANPLVVALGPPVEVMFPFNVADVWAIDVAAFVVTEGKAPVTVMDRSTQLSFGSCSGTASFTSAQILALWVPVVP